MCVFVCLCVCVHAVYLSVRACMHVSVCLCVRYIMFIVLTYESGWLLWSNSIAHTILSNILIFML